MADLKSKAANATSDVSHIRDRNPQNFLLIWIDVSIDESKPDCQKTLKRLRTLVNNVNLCTTADQCIQFLQDTTNEKAFLIVSGSLGQTLVPQIHPRSQVDAIYVFCGDKTRHEAWAKDYPKVKGVHTSIETICKELPIVVKQCNQDSVVVSVVAADEKASDGNLNQLPPCFMYTQIFKEILLEMEHDDKSKADLVAHCRALYHKNEGELKVIDEFEKDYRLESVIQWYTRECFTYHTLNRALRKLEADTIIKMGFFIRDLHQAIQKLYKTQVDNYPEKCFIVYRGQGLPIEDFKRLQKSKGGLLSFNNFLSTSKSRKEPLRFATEALAKTNVVGIVFRMSIDVSISSAPFADIEHISCFGKEEEILFAMHTVFHIGTINKIDDTKSLYQVDLQLTADNDEQLRNLTKIISEEAAGPTGWSRLGSLLVKIDQFDKAEEVYLTLLEQPCSDRHKGHLYNQLGYIKRQKGDYEEALDYYKKSLAMYQKIHPPQYSQMSTSYNNIGGVYYNMKQYSKALQYYEKDLEINQKIHPANDRHLAVLYNNIGTVCDKMEKYSNALMFYEKVLKIEQKIFPPNHPTLATTYSNIASTYFSVKDYSKALPIFEKGLEIRRQTLISTHHLLANSYGNIGSVYLGMKEYTKALSNFERALEIYLHTFSPDHHHVKNIQDGIRMAKENLQSKT